MPTNQNALLAVGKQVIYRKQLRTGTAIEIGNVLSLDPDGIHAVVDFPTLYKRSKLRLDELQDTGEVFGGVRVQHSPARRTIQTYLP